ncbi:MAG: hypothetical protein ACRD2Z_05385 [Thermoanaerobaculia bacterium]
MRSVVVLALLAALPGWLHLPAAVERWLYNPRERTQMARRHLAEGRPEEAMRALATASRLRPGDPRVRYNTGTGLLLTGSRGAVDELEAAVASLGERQATQPELAADAWYNLGTARLAERDAAGAVAALEETLRRRPKDEDAKFNLELALQELERQRSGLRRPQEAPGGDRQGREEQGQGEDGTDTSRPSERAGGGRDAQPEGEPGSPRPQPQTASEDLLRRFERQPDMTAAQAAAILEAVENLERAHRREEAQRRGQRKNVVEKDW